ncbi:uncharacterized protein LOC144817811 [Lissotriton helveticus]
MGGASSTPNNDEDPDLPCPFIEMRAEARINHLAGRGAPQVAMLILDDTNGQVWNSTCRFYGGNHTEAELISEVENSSSASVLDRGGSHVYLYTENSPCVSRRNCGTPCMQLLIDFAGRHPNCTVDVGFQRPYGSRFTNDTFRMSNFIDQLKIYNHTNGLPEPKIPSNLHFHRVNVTGENTYPVHDDL